MVTALRWRFRLRAPKNSDNCGWCEWQFKTSGHRRIFCLFLWQKPGLLQHGFVGFPLATHARRLNVAVSAEPPH